MRQKYKVLLPHQRYHCNGCFFALKQGLGTWGKWAICGPHWTSNMARNIIFSPKPEDNIAAKRNSMRSTWLDSKSKRISLTSHSFLSLFLGGKWLDFEINVIVLSRPANDIPQIKRPMIINRSHTTTWHNFAAFTFPVRHRVVHRAHLCSCHRCTNISKIINILLHSFPTAVSAVFAQTASYDENPALAGVTNKKINDEQKRNLREFW